MSDTESMEIPEEAVGAALNALIEAMKADDTGWVDTDTPTEATIDIRWFDLVAATRDALEAAAPHMLNLAKREAWDANVEIQRLRAELAKFEALRPYTVEDQRQHGETW